MATNDGKPFVPEHKKRSAPSPPVVADEHPHKTGIVIEQENCLYLEQSIDGDISYDSVPLYDDPKYSLQLIAQSSEHWCACDGGSILNSQTDTTLDTYSVNSRFMASSVFKDDEDINSSPRPFKHKYWIKHFNIDESLF